MSLLNYEKNVDKKFASEILAKFCKLYEDPQVERDELIRTANKMILVIAEKDREFAKTVLQVLQKRYRDTDFKAELK